MLARLGKGLKPYVKRGRVDVTWSNNMTGQIARRQQEGIAEQWSAAKAKKVYGTPDYSEPATRSQAKALRAAGYMINTKSGRSQKRPTIKWIVEHLSSGKAGIILRALRKAKRTTSWETKPTARPFLGVTKPEAAQLLSEVLQGVKHG